MVLPVLQKPPRTLPPGHAKKIKGLSLAETGASRLALLSPTKGNKPLINSPNLMADQTPASPPALMSLIDWT